MHIFPGVLVGLAIAFGGEHAPELSLTGVLLVDWIAWSMVVSRLFRTFDLG